MDQYQLGVAFAAAHLAELRRQADRRAGVALWPSAAAILVAVVALLTG